MSFDTTASNTGPSKGACVLLEEKIGQELLWLPCRHHILEIILAEVFNVCFGSSSSLDILLFKRFKEAWPNISTKKFSTLNIPDGAQFLVECSVASLRNAIASKSQVRDDYLEIVELSLAVLGQAPANMHWRAPGPVHHARWMAKLIYAIKIMLFRDQTEAFKMTKKEQHQLQRFVHFGTLLYTKAWTISQYATEAPTTDLNLWTDLRRYQQIDPDIATAAITVLEKHLWYLSDELVGLALFSDNVQPEAKVGIVKRLEVQCGERNVRGDPNQLKNEVCLGDFANKRTTELFTRLQISDTFLCLPPEKWNESDDYKTAKERISRLRIVNDTAERGVKLFEDFNNLLTNDEQQKQFVLQVVERNRKSIPSESTKKSVIAALKTNQ